MELLFYLNGFVSEMILRDIIVVVNELVDLNKLKWIMDFFKDKIIIYFMVLGNC